MFRRKLIIQIKDKIIKQFGISTYDADWILGRRKKNEVKLLQCKFEQPDGSKAILYKIEITKENSKRILYSKLNSLNKLEENNSNEIIENKEINLHISNEISKIEIDLPYLPTNLPWLFDIGNNLIIPSLQLLWIYGDYIKIPEVIIPTCISQFIFNGADLMMCGIIVQKSINLKTINKGQLWSVRCEFDKKPIALGISLVDWIDLVNSKFKKGKVLRILHHIKDNLSKEGGFEFKLTTETDQIVESVNENGNEIKYIINESTNNLKNFNNKMQNPNIEIYSKFIDSKNESKTSENSYINSEQIQNIQINQNNLSEYILPILDDDLSLSLQSIKDNYSFWDIISEFILIKILTSIELNQLPLEISAIWDKINRLYNKSSQKQLNIKLTSHGKISKFFIYYQKLGFFILKQGRNNNQTIISINKNIIDDTYIKNKSLYDEILYIQKLLSRDLYDIQLFNNCKDTNKDKNKNKSNDINLSLNSMEIITIYQPLSSIQGIFDFVQSKFEIISSNIQPLISGEVFIIKTSKGEKLQTFYSSKQIRKILEIYINLNNLKVKDPVEENNRKLSHVKLDHLLSIIYKSDINADIISLASIFKDFFKFLNTFHYIKTNNQNKKQYNENPLIFKGICKSIIISVESRQGGKKYTTIISPYITHFNLDPSLVADICQKKFACSASATQIKGYSAPNNIGVVIQGNVASKVASLLSLHWGVPKAYIQVN
ncbi:translation initiation factor SUI1 family protein [Cryptosporidium muris RN66]|uniref:Translation initiation factor SUI1 family protein n=1 Tax=Cryptosporidium muris (strain RN66) TaxID=441375 RepID=B6AEC6_CRYMR|nr:translation initiation factor SUI1 family protein [Cryptosporidium muris RN66]EEA06543.1 translation initiation factor SUI1 family protein [Cryptosporidium muris RN66]|eukprot:XP_002140892.1 translation initiation factor SUI1 family protein [Cryptosporidium muris RN66]